MLLVEQLSIRTYTTDIQGVLQHDRQTVRGDSRNEDNHY